MRSTLPLFKTFTHHFLPRISVPFFFNFPASLRHHKVLVMSESRALELGYTPKAVLKAWSYSAVDPFEDLLLGPTFATSSLLKQAGLTMKEVDVVEFHEAFAGQVREGGR